MVHTVNTKMYIKPYIKPKPEMKLLYTL